MLVKLNRRGLKLQKLTSFTFTIQFDLAEIKSHRDLMAFLLGFDIQRTDENIVLLYDGETPNCHSE